MKAVRIHEHGSEEVLIWEEVSLPEIKDDQVLVEIKAAAINHLDIWVRKGIPGISLPMIIGSDGAGVVAEVGKGVDKFNIGDKIKLKYDHLINEFIDEKLYAHLASEIGAPLDWTQFYKRL